MNSPVISIPPYVADILSRLESAGFPAYAVGGCVRDSLLGLPVHDWDACTSALPGQTAQVFRDYRVIPTGIRHGTVTVLTDGHSVEITTFRSDGGYVGHRRPEQVSFKGSVEDDLSRRDFTVNAMAYGLSGGLVDIFGGRDDLEHGVIRCVGDPSVRFGEDALRILRMYRFAFRLGFSIEADTRRAAAELSGLVLELSRERITGEFGRILRGPRAYEALRVMEEDGVLRHVFPSPLKVERLLDSLPPDENTRLAFLLSAHSTTSVKYMLERGRYSSRDIGLICKVCALIASAPPSGAPDVKRALRVSGQEAFGVYLSILKEAGREAYVTVSDIYKRVIDSGECYEIRGLKISGDDITALGVSGRAVGRILELLLERVTERPEDNDRDVLLRYAADIAAGETGGDDVFQFT